MHRVGNTTAGRIIEEETERCHSGNGPSGQHNIPLPWESFPLAYDISYVSFPLGSLSFSSQLQQNTSETKSAKSIAFNPLLSISFETSPITISPLVRVVQGPQLLSVTYCPQAWSKLIHSTLKQFYKLSWSWCLPSLNLFTTLPKLNYFFSWETHPQLS